jgi:serine protease Do
MMRLKALILTAIGAMLAGMFAVPAAAQDTQDVEAVSRSVVRVVVQSGSIFGESGIGMGSGVAITPSKIITNAHVVERAYGNDGFVGIVPSEGKKRFVGKIVAYRADIDLAIIDIGSGRLPPATLYTASPGDGSNVAALGYPYAVDRALATGLEAMITPQGPVKTYGHVSGRRSNAQYDTVVHDASIGRGNSGGPLVDTCGRVVGINSFLSLTEGVDATFSFAISVRELLPFLKTAGVNPATIATPCLSGGEVQARNDAMARADAEQVSREASKTAALAAKADKEKAAIRDAIVGERENSQAIAAVLLVLAALGAAGGMVLFTTGDPVTRKKRAAIAFAVAAVVLLIAIIVFFTRAKLSDVDDRYLKAHPDKPVTVAGDTTGEGAKICVLVPDRSLVKVAQPGDVPLTWKEGGCVNGKTQYGNNAGTWSRAFVPNTEQTVTVQSYDPIKSRYTVDRYLMSADAMDKARAVRARYTNKTCVSDPAARQSVSEMEAAIRQTLPATAHEHLVYDCRPGKPG